MLAKATPAQAARIEAMHGAGMPEFALRPGHPAIERALTTGARPEQFASYVPVALQ